MLPRLPCVGPDCVTGTLAAEPPEPLNRSKNVVLALVGFTICRLVLQSPPNWTYERICGPVGVGPGPEEALETVNGNPLEVPAVPFCTATVYDPAVCRVIVPPI